MRAWCLLAILSVLSSGCSIHRAWTDGYSACVPNGCGGCDCDSGGGLFGHKCCLFQKKSQHSSCGCMSGCNPCGSCSPCFSDCGPMFSDCSGCSTCGDVIWDGGSGCSSCAQGQTVYGGTGCGGCANCMQQQFNGVPQMQMQMQQAAPPPPPVPAADPAAPGNQPPPEPTKAQLMPLQAPPTQPVQYLEAAPIPQVPPASSYYPPAAVAPAGQAVQPVLWVPATPSQVPPLTVPPAR